MINLSNKKECEVCRHYGKSADHFFEHLHGNRMKRVKYGTYAPCLITRKITGLQFTLVTNLTVTVAGVLVSVTDLSSLLTLFPGYVILLKVMPVITPSQPGPHINPDRP